MVPTDRAGAQPAAPRSEWLGIRLQDQEFALDIHAIREIRGWSAATALPHAPAHIRGMINLRGTVLVVIDLAARLGLTARVPDAASVVVVVEAGGRRVGLLVEAVSDIIPATAARRWEVPETGSPAARAFIQGVLTLDRRIISILSIPAILPEVQAEMSLSVEGM